MNCDDARLLMGADPGSQPDELERHLSGCAGCTRFRQEMRSLDEKVRRALDTPPPAAERLPHSSRRAASRPPKRLWALAATVIAGVGVAFLLWTVRPATSLAADVVRHVDGEPQSWSATRPETAPQVDPILRAAGVELADSSAIVYARTCRFRGHDVPHLVVLVDHRPYTVMVLRFETVKAAQHFSEGGYTGILVPTPSGSLAILGLGAADVDAIAGQIQRQLRFAR